MKFTFLIPNTSWFSRRYWHHFPYTEALLAGVLKENGYEVNVIDLNINNSSPADLVKILWDTEPKIIGISAMALEYRETVHEAFRIIKETNPMIITVLGGVYSTLSPELAQKDKNIDFIILGEGELALVNRLYTLELLKLRPSKQYQTSGESWENLDTLPLPDYSIFDMQHYTNYIQKYNQTLQHKQLPVGFTMTSRGCPFKCTFCASNSLYGQNYRTMSVERVMQEVDMLIEEYGVKEIIFLDDTWLLPRLRAMQIINELAKRHYSYNKNPIIWKPTYVSVQLLDYEMLESMKESGCYELPLSIESGCQSTLKLMKKPINLNKAVKTLETIQELNFDHVISNFIIGMPGETWENIRETFRFAEAMIDAGLLHYAFFHIATPFPGTELYKECLEKNYLPKNFSFENHDYYGFGKGVITTDEFTPEELHVMRAFEWDRINFKTEKQCEKIGEIMGISAVELESWRKETRRSVGLHVGEVDRR